MGISEVSVERRLTSTTRRIGGVFHATQKALFGKSTTSKLKCTSCERTFYYIESLAAHKKMHAKKKVCQHCDRNFGNNFALERHLRENCSKISIGDRKKLLESDAKEKTPVRRRLTRPKEELLKFFPIKGIGQTPRKKIQCYECNDNFQNPLEFAVHAEQCAAPIADVADRH